MFPQNLEAARRAADGLTSEGKSKKLRETVKQHSIKLRDLFEADTVDWEKFLNKQAKLELLQQRCIDKQDLEIGKDWDLWSPNFTDSSSLLTTLHRAATDNQVHVVQWCLEKNANVNAKTTMGRTPLHYACDGDAVRVIRVLLENAADPNCVTLSLMTPLHFCCRTGSYNAVLVLLEANQIIDVNAMDSQNRRPDMMTRNKEITKAVGRYRSKLDKKRKRELVEYKLERLFKAFDKDDSGLINEEEWLNAQARLARYFQDHCEDSILLAFDAVDKDSSKAIDLDEFKKSHISMMEAAGTCFHTLMSNLADMENALFEDEREALQQNAAGPQELMRIATVNVSDEPLSD